MIQHKYVSQRQQRKHIIKKIKKESSNIRLKNKKRLNPSIRSVVSVATLIIASYVVFHLPQLTIYAISIEEENDRIENKTTLEKTIEQKIYKKNYISIKLLSHKYNTEIKKEYDFIKKISFKNFKKGHITVVIEHNNPNIMIETNQSGLQMGSYNNKIFQAQENYKNDKIIKIILPEYYKSDNLKGIFHVIKEQKLYESILKTKKYLEAKKIFYHIGGAKIIIINEIGQKIIFDLQTPIEEQIEKLISLQKHYKDYKEISEIDLGSTPQPIIKLTRTMQEK